MNTKSENNKLAGVCGLYGGVCNAFIATTEEPYYPRNYALQGD